MKYDTFGFDYDKIIVFCNSMESDKEKIDYLEWILKEFEIEWRNNKTVQYTIRGKVHKTNGAPACHFNSFYRLIQKEISEIRKKENSTPNQGNTDFPKTKIHWTGTEKEIINLIEALNRYDLISIDMNKKYEFIAKHFINKNKKPFKAHQLSVVNQDADLDRDEKIKKIIKETNPDSQI